MHSQARQIDRPYKKKNIIKRKLNAKLGNNEFMKAYARGHYLFNQLFPVSSYLLFQEVVFKMRKRK